MSMAGKLMEQPNLSEAEFKMVEQCWELSEEDEDLADYAKNNLEPCWEVIRRLTNSPSGVVRWQVYEVLGGAAAKGESLLREGIKDKDSYCRRRAILSLAKLHPNDAAIIAGSLSTDPDTYIRQAVKELLKSRPPLKSK